MASPPTPPQVAVYPTAGMGFALDANGKVPQSVAQTLPGYVFNYTAITAGVNITDTAEATATAIITTPSIQFDGNPVWVEFFSPEISLPTSANGYMIMSLFEGSTQICRLAVVQAPSNTTTELAIGFGKRRFTPVAGPHTYKLTAFVPATTGTPFIAAGSGGTSGAAESYLMFTKA